MRRDDWSELPEEVRAAVQAWAGPIRKTVPAGEGQSCDTALTLHRDGMPPVFLKGVRGVSREMRWLRNEVESAGLVAGIGPAVLFHHDVGDWFVVAFEYLEGRPAKLAPGSPDLSVVATALGRLGAIRAPELRSLGDRWKARWWRGLAGELRGRDPGLLEAWEDKAPGLVAGDSLVHTDLHEDQFVLDGNGGVRVVDWGWPASGAAWVDPAFLVIRLVGAGHHPADAESWARSHTCWGDASSESVTAFAVYVAGLWSAKATEFLARTARGYADWRLGRTRERSGRFY